MRPGTVDYSKWDAIHTSSDEEEAPVTSPSKPRAAAQQQPAPAANAPPMPPDAGEDDIISRMLPVLLANESAMRALGGFISKAAAEVSLFALLPEPLAAALRAVASSNDVERGLARMAVVCRASRRGADASPLSTHAKRELVVRREYVVDAITSGLKCTADADEHARANPRTYDVEYVSSGDEEGNILEGMLYDTKLLVRMLELMATWTEIPAPATRGDGELVEHLTSPALGSVMLNNIARHTLLRDFGAAERLDEASAQLRRLQSETNRLDHNEYVAKHGGTLAPPPPAAAEPPQLSPKQRMAYDGCLMISQCRMMSGFEEAFAATGHELQAQQ